MVSSNQQDQQEAYLSYLREREPYLQGYVEAQKERDKTLVALYSVTLGFSLTLARFIGFPPQYIWLLAISWICLFLSLIFILFSLIASPYAWLEELASIERDYQELCRNSSMTSSETRSINSAEIQISSRLSKDFTNFFNWASYVLFIVGLCMLIAFATHDLLDASGARYESENVMPNAVLRSEIFSATP
ncbi:MAG: hypothetical protein ACFB12_08175 [Leptolyngbyaceae cyanobacterium]